MDATNRFAEAARRGVEKFNAATCRDVELVHLCDDELRHRTVDDPYEAAWLAFHDVLLAASREMSTSFGFELRLFVQPLCFSISSDVKCYPVMLASKDRLGKVHADQICNVDETPRQGLPFTFAMVMGGIVFEVVGRNGFSKAIEVVLGSVECGRILKRHVMESEHHTQIASKERLNDD